MSEKALIEVGGTDLVPVEKIQAMTRKVYEVMEKAMVKDRHYGVIPGTGNKPTLLKGGAELLGVMFRLRAEYTHDRHIENDDLTVFSKCALFHIETGQKIGEGNAICSTKESKYAYRNAGRKCPSCGKESIFKSKEDYGGGFYCNKKSGGCGASWKHHNEKTGQVIEANAEVIKGLETQPQGKVPNEDLPDVWNTVSKMADKRSHVAAMLSATAASEVFTQDLEDMQENIAAGNPAPAPATQKAPGATEGVVETISAEILKVRKMKEADGTLYVEMALSGGLLLKAGADALGVKAKNLEGKPALVEFNNKTGQVITIRGLGEQDAEAGTAVEP